MCGRMEKLFFVWRVIRGMNNVKKVIQLAVAAIWLNFSPCQQHIRCQRNMVWCQGILSRIFVVSFFLKKKRGENKSATINFIVDFGFRGVSVLELDMPSSSTPWCGAGRLSFIYDHHICSFYAADNNRCVAHYNGVEHTHMHTVMLASFVCSSFDYFVGFELRFYHTFAFAFAIWFFNGTLFLTTFPCHGYSTRESIITNNDTIHCVEQTLSLAPLPVHILKNNAISASASSCFVCPASPIRI